jgi:hypothetical protein
MHLLLLLFLLHCSRLGSVLSANTLAFRLLAEAQRVQLIEQEREMFAVELQSLQQQSMSLEDEYKRALTTLQTRLLQEQRSTASLKTSFEVTRTTLEQKSQQAEADMEDDVGKLQATIQALMQERQQLHQEVVTANQRAAEAVCVPFFVSCALALFGW